tara:strand:- start:16 stop:459 length:444 start_codon:yes stop_codon:yes gene_type:complete
MAKKKNVDEKISEALEMEPEVIDAEIVRREPREIQTTGDSIDLKRDYRSVRTNLHDIIDRGNDAIDGILQVASEGESPRAYEVAAQMIKTVADANKDLIELHEKMKKIRSDTPESQKNITNNSLFVGSTKELQDLVKDHKKAIDGKQ